MAEIGGLSTTSEQKMTLLSLGSLFVVPRLPVLLTSNPTESKVVMIYTVHVSIPADKDSQYF